MRQRRKLCRNAKDTKLILYVFAPSARAFETLAKAVAQTLLVANLAHSRSQRRVTHALRPQGQHPGLLVAQIVSFTAGQLAQNRLVVFAPLCHEALAVPSFRASRQVDPLIDHGEIATVVQHPVGGRVVAENVDPEIDVGLQTVRNGKAFVRRCRQAEEHEEKQAESTFSCHLS